VKNADLAILGLIREKPRYGYEIEQVIEERTMRNWTDIGFSSIYHILSRLENNGYIAGRLHESPGSGPARKIYEMTARGRDAWNKATLEALSTPVKCDQTFFLGLLGLPILPLPDLMEALDQYVEQLKERRQQASARWQEIGEETSEVIDAMFEHCLHMIDAEIDWIVAFRARLAAEAAHGR